MPAVPVDDAQIDPDTAWDAPAVEATFDKEAGDYSKLCAWTQERDGVVEGWGAHHNVDSAGAPGDANLRGVEAVMAMLTSQPPDSIPEDERQAVWDHLAAHYRTAGVDEANIPKLATRSRVPATAIRSEYRNVPESRISPRSEFELREVPNGTGGTNLRFTGFASVTNADYEMEDWLGPWTESITVGAFGKTLSEGADVAFLLNHSGMTLARTKPGTLKLSEVSEGPKSPVYGITGLHSEAQLDPTNMYVQAMRSAVDRGDLDEMSFAFRVMRQEWNEDYDRRWINEVSLDKGDVSLVNYGANPTTGGTVALRQKLGIRNDDLPVDRLVALVKRSRLFDIAYEIREGRVLSSSNATKLQEALDALHTTDDADIPGIVRQLQSIDAALDTGQSAISAVLSVADPDGDPADLEPDLVPPPKSESALPDYSIEARSRLEALRHRKGAA